jgi:hypothetical protein
VWHGSLHLWGVELKCHVLSDGQRVIELSSMHKLLAAMVDGTVEPSDDEELDKVARWVKAKGLP